ncbi:hypothetical protein BGZ52_001190 [Haplosporangium bisporale]|nr:hypothetical protein BGZ52_001190 [Haplosporangium bisporale]KFH66521.1 hypothetical protein MVEG_07046 [Podila verticillata NRRL 6337]
MGFRWNSPLAQVIAVGFICFCCPGMFNAINSLGGGGQIDSNVGQNANVALYTCFAIFGLLSGAIHNKLGPKWTILLGGTTYVLYVGSYVAYNNSKARADGTKDGTFNIVAGGILGIGAGMLWTAQGAIMMAYPREQDKGKYIGYFWGIFNAGAVVGSIIGLAINIEKEKRENLSNPVYIAFMSIMAVGTLIALSLAPPSSVTHSNGEHIQIRKFPTWTGELVAILKLFGDWRMICLIPMFASSNWFTSYQFGSVNGAYFSLRTQSFNAIFYWFAQIAGSYAVARVLDYQGVNRRTRALWGLGINTVIVVATYIGGIYFQKGYTRADKLDPKDFKDDGFVGPLILFILYGLTDATWQTYCYWLMGALSNDVTVLSRYAGFYKGIQSAGAAVAWRINAVETPYMTELIVVFALMMASLPGALFLSLRLKDHTEDEVDEQGTVVHDEKDIGGKTEA